MDTETIVLELFNQGRMERFGPEVREFLSEQYRATPDRPVRASWTTCWVYYQDHTNLRVTLYSLPEVAMLLRLRYDAIILG